MKMYEGLGTDLVRNDDSYCTFSTYTPINNVDLDVGRYLGPSYSTTTAVEYIHDS